MSAMIIHKRSIYFISSAETSPRRVYISRQSLWLIGSRCSGRGKIILCSEQILVVMRFFSYHTDKSIEQAKDAPRFVSFAAHSRELYLCQRPSENTGSERTTLICSN